MGILLLHPWKLQPNHSRIMFAITIMKMYMAGCKYIDTEHSNKMYLENVFFFLTKYLYMQLNIQFSKYSVIKLIYSCV